jgi:hypothetical protein
MIRQSNIPALAFVAADAFEQEPHGQIRHLRKRLIKS